MRRRSGVAVLTAVIFVLALIAPPAYGDTSANGLSDPANKAASLDQLKATDTQLTAAISTLQGEVTAQQASLDAAKQAVAAADKAVLSVQSTLSDTQSKLSVLQEAESKRAVELYMSPNEDDFVSHFLSSSGFQDASQRDALMSVMSGNDYDMLDSLQATQREFKKQQKKALDAQKTANERRDSEQQKLNSLNTALGDQNKLEGSLKQRISGYAVEDTASARGVTADTGRASRGNDNSTDNSRQSSQGLAWPLHGSHQINSPYGMRWGRMHEGIDIYATQGQAIYAAKAGTVTFAGNESGYGLYVCIQHGGGFQTCYSHEAHISVSAGQQVQQGDQLGTAGVSGDATGVNLHFETCSSTGKECFYGTFHNPVDYLP